MYNAVVCRTMENVENRMQLYMTTDDKKAKKWFSKSNFENTIQHDGLHLIEMYKNEIEYNTPLLVGTSILDLSKLGWMDFQYNTIEKNFKDMYTLIFSDTDSLVYSLEHEDIYEWIKENQKHYDLLEIDNANKQVLGMFRMKGTTGFIALNPQVYSINHQRHDNDDNVVIEK